MPTIALGVVIWGVAGVTDLPADETHDAFGQRRGELAGVRLRIENILVDREIAVRTDGDRSLVEEQQLD